MNAQRKGTVISVGSGSKREIISGSGPVIKVEGGPIKQEVTRSVDLAFVIDTTGSMSDKIDALLETCARFVDEFAGLNLSLRVAIVAFGDLTVFGDRIEATAFTSKVEVAKKSLANIPQYSGGGNEGESSLEALEKALALPFRASAVKAIILITDEPALQRSIRASDVINTLTRREVLTFAVSPPLGYFKEMAVKTGGKWYQVAANTDFTDLLEMFKEVAREVSQVVSDVYSIGDGSVAAYLQLKPPER